MTYDFLSQSKADRQAAGIQQQVYRQQSGKTDRQACSQVVGWRVADRQKVSRHSGRQEAGRPAWSSMKCGRQTKDTDIQTGSQAVGTAGGSKAAGGGHRQVAIQGRQTYLTGRDLVGRQTILEDRQAIGRQAKGKQATGWQATGRQATGRQATGRRAAGRQSGGRQSAGRHWGVGRKTDGRKTVGR